MKTSRMNHHSSSFSMLHMVAQYQKKVTTPIVDEDMNVVTDKKKDKNTNSLVKAETATSNISSTSTPLVSILFNINARGVTTSMVETIQKKLSSNDNVKIYTTTSPEEGTRAIQEIMQSKQQQQPRLVVPIGGDGTLCTMLQTMYDETTTSTDDENCKLPLLGYIPMGTGNAVGSVVGCKKKKKRFSSTTRQVVDTIQELITIAQQMEENSKDSNIMKKQQQQATFDIVELPLLKITTHRSGSTATTKDEQYITFFAGLGFDSLMLQDYYNLQEYMKTHSFWRNYRKTFSSVLGYCVALVTRTLPQCLERNAHQVPVEITTTTTAAASANKNNKSSSLWIDHRRGDVARPLDDNDDDSEEERLVLYRGTTGIVAASTVPYYGGGLRLFPFASLYPNQFQLRLGRIHPMRGMLNLPGIFKGTYRDFTEDSFGCLDFILSQCSIRIMENDATNENNKNDATTTTSSNKKNQYPVQQAGELVGACTQVCIETVPNTTARFVTLLPSRIIQGE